MFNGGKENGLSQIFNPNLKIAANVSEVDRCKKIEDSGWLAIYYCLMVIHEGNDKFLNDKSKWSNIDIDAVKSILVAHIKSFSKN